MIMRRVVFRILSVSVLMALFAWCAIAQDKPQGGQPSPEDMQKMMQQYMKMGAPGPEHQKLALLAGEWTNVSKMWMDPKSEPMETPPGTHKGEMILGGRFVRFTETGDMMGTPMEGWGLMGFNKLRGEYQMIWIDNSATPMYSAVGKADSTGNVITLMGKVDDPMTGDKDKDVKYIYRFLSDNKIVFEMWDSSAPGQFYKSMETTYTKK
jgi:hypothetical protein